MSKVKYDVSDVEAGGGGEEPQPGTYPGKVVSLVHRTKKNNSKDVISDFEVCCDIGKEYVRLWTYVKLPDDPNYKKESHGWKVRELTDALGLPPKGEIDPVKITKEQPAVLVKVMADSHRDSGEYRGKIKNLFPIGKEKPPTDDADEPEATNEEGPYERADIEGWPDDDIRTYAAELGVEDITGRGWKTKLVDAIISAQDESGSEGESEAEAEDEPTAGNSTLLEGVEEDVLVELRKIAAGEEDMSEWGDDDLKWIVEGAGISGNVPTSGRAWQAKARAGIAEFAAEALGDAPDGAGDHDAGAEEVPDDLDDVGENGEPLWSDQDLKDEIASRNEQGTDIKIAGRWTRDKAIAAIREDNKNAEPF